MERCLATEARKVKWKSTIRVTPRKAVSLSKKPSDVRVPEVKSFPASNDVGIPPYVDVDPYHPKLV